MIQYYKELEIPFSEIMEQIDEDLRFHKDDKKKFLLIATELLKEMREIIEGWYQEFQEVPMFNRLKEVVNNVP